VIRWTSSINAARTGVPSDHELELVGGGNEPAPRISASACLGTLSNPPYKLTRTRCRGHCRIAISVVLEFLSRRIAHSPRDDQSHPGPPAARNQPAEVRGLQLGPGVRPNVSFRFAKRLGVPSRSLEPPASSQLLSAVDKRRQGSRPRLSGVGTT